MNETGMTSRRAFWISGALIIVLVVILILGHQSRSQQALRKYLVQLEAKGEKLTFAELAPNRPQAANASALIRAASRLSSSNFNPGRLELQKFSQPGRAEVLWRQTQPVSDAEVFQLKPSSATRVVSKPRHHSWDELAAEIRSNAVALAEIREILREPPASSGVYPSLAGPPGVNFVRIRSAAYWLVAATITSLHEGRTDEALETLEALTGLGRMDREDIWLVSQMIRVAVARLELQATWEMLQVVDLSEAQLERLQSMWARTDLLEGTERGLVGERAGVLEVWKVLRHSPSSGVRNLLSFGSGKSKVETVIEDYLGLPAYRMTTINDDELYCLQTMQESVELVRQLIAHVPWLRLKRPFEKRVTEMRSMADTPQRWRYPFTASVVPNCARAIDTVVRAETERQMTAAVIAIRRFQLRYGKLPASLERLVPQFLSSLPLDGMNGQPLSYRASADETFVLYSVGEDGRDDGGDPGVPPGGKPDFWTGRDAVWPAAASTEAVRLGTAAAP